MMQPLFITVRLLNIYTQIMRKLLLFAALVIFTLSACQKDYYTVVPANKTIFATIKSSGWTTSDQGFTYSTKINMPELTTDVNDRDAILVYLTYDENTFEQIPETYSGIAYSYTSQPGKLTIEIQSSDALVKINPPGSLTVKIVLIPSEYE